jgi:1,4-dihydroxy-6-naphthoate synthase
MPFQDIMPAVRDGVIDAGLVIHEARFTYSAYGLKLMADLGNWWESDTKLPIPLGAIIARRSLDLDSIAGWIRASLQYAWNQPVISQEYILRHAQELSLEVAKAHINLYVNEFSENLGSKGYEAVSVLLSRAMEEKLVPVFDINELNFPDNG